MFVSCIRSSVHSKCTSGPWRVRRRLHGITFLCHFTSAIAIKYLTTFYSLCTHQLEWTSDYFHFSPFGFTSGLSVITIPSHQKSITYRCNTNLFANNVHPSIYVVGSIYVGCFETRLVLRYWSRLTRTTQSPQLATLETRKIMEHHSW